MPSPGERHLAELDVVRCWAFLGVFVFHVLLIHPPEVGSAFALAAYNAAAVIKCAGRYGVDMFFTLSAYLITSLLLNERARSERIHLGRFYMRRVLRIWPLYFLVILLVFGAALVLHETQMRSYFWPFVLFAANWAWVFLGTPATPHAIFLSLMVFWSLGIEEQFYLVWPLFLRKSTLGGLRKAAWGMLAISAMVRLISWASEVPHPGIYANTLAHLDPIAVGALLAVEWAETGPNAPATLRRRILGHPASLAVGIGLFLLGGWMEASHGINSFLFILLGYPSVAWGGYLVLACILLNLKPSRTGIWFRFQAYLGKISYGLYVIHAFVLVATPPIAGWITRSHGTLARMGLLQMSVNFVLALAATVVLAHLSYVYFESPFLRLKSRFSGMAGGRAAGTADPVPAP
ncbi:MAG TPA: acyltransferase [Holophagaceae bacterium]|nr:acyltransferase [Holophagaceae bacterium]